MSADTVRQMEFGKDLGVVHEMIVTGRKVGAGKEFYATLAHDESLFRRLVEVVSEPERGDALDARIRSIMRELRSNGPIVDYSAMSRFVEGNPNLSPFLRKRVRQLIMTWRNWFEAYLELLTEPVDENA